MKRIVLLLIILMVMSFRVSAQDETQNYRLRVPTAEEYLSTIPTALQLWREELPPYYSKSPDQPIVGAILGEMYLRYPNEVIFAQSFETLRGAYDAFRYYVFGINPIVDEIGWLEAIFKAWMRDNPVDLGTVEQLDVPGFTILVHPVDFDGDGSDEYWLDFHGGNYSAFLVLRRDTNQPEGYRFVPTSFWITNPPPMLGDSHIETILLDDINDDGLPEWVVFDSLYANFQFCGNLSVLTWNDGSLVDLLIANDHFCTPEPFEIANFDDDTALEIHQSNQEHDVWTCNWWITKTFDWSIDIYRLSSEETSFEDSFGCALRQAEMYMWEHNYWAAIPLYEHALVLEWESQYPEGQTRDQDIIRYEQRHQYARARLALSYMLVGRSNEAMALLEELNTEEPTAPLIGELIQAMLNAEPTSLSICIAAYNVFDEYESSSFTYRELPIDAVVGRTEDIWNVMSDSPPEAEKAGCDAPQMINSRLPALTFPINVSPVDMLEDAGLAVETSFTTDLNDDGVNEFVVWLVARVEPLFFAPVENEYVLSRPLIRRPNEYSQLATHTLPNNHGFALVDWMYLDIPHDNRDAAYYDFPQHPCVPSANVDYSESNGSMRLWRLQDNTLVQMLEVPLCESREIADIFQNDGNELYAPSLQRDPNDPTRSQYTDSIYQWDETQQNYIPPEAEPIIEQTYVPGVGFVEEGSEVEAALMTDAYIFQAIADAQVAFSDANYESALAILDNADTNHDPSVNSIILNAIYYWRALTLEQLGRIDEALTQYISIYEAAPESSWGQLAALHLEHVE